MSITLKQPCDEGIIRSSSAIAPCGKAAEPWILAATILGSGMAFIDGTVVNVALPSIQADLNASVIDVQWVVAAYSLFLSALILVGGSLGDRLGRRLIFAAGAVLFALSSVLCALVSSVDQLIMARSLQGVGGALLVPGSMAIIGASFSEENRGKAIGTWSGFSAITAAVGPVLGGWLVENISWRAAFFINVPIAIVVLLIVFWHVPESRDENHSKGLDWWGTILATVGLGSLVYGLIESSRLRFDDVAVLLSIVTGITMITAFVIIEKRTPHPMLPPELFRSRNFTGANIMTLFLYAGLNGALFFFSLNLIQVQGYSATAAGAAFLPFVLIMFLLSRWSGGLLNRYGARLPLTIGPMIAAVAFILFTVPTISTNYWTSYFPAVLLLGLGMAISVAPLTTTVINSVKQNQAGVASGISNAVARTAALLAIAVFGIIMVRAFNHSFDRQLESLNLPLSVHNIINEQRSKLAGIKYSDFLEPKTKNEIVHAVDHSFISGFRVVMIVAVVLALASSFSSWFMIKDKTAIHK